MATGKPKTDAEQLRLKREERARRARRRNRQLLGLALCILILVGAYSIVSRGVGLVATLMEGGDDTDEYKAMFEPFIWFDVLPFDSLAQADENTLKQAVIWGILIQQGEVLERNANGEPLIPAEQVDQYAAKLFGPSFRFSEHATFTDEVQQLTYIYSPAAQVYTAPSTGLMPLYLASVVDIQRESGGVRRVVMGYVSSMLDNQLIAAPDFDHPAKYMDFMMRRDGGSYYLYAIVNNTTLTPAAAAPAASQPDETSQAPPSSAPASSAPPQSAASGPGEDPDNEPGEENT